MLHQYTQLTYVRTNTYTPHMQAITNGGERHRRTESTQTEGETERRRKDVGR